MKRAFKAINTVFILGSLLFGSLYATEEVTEELETSPTNIEELKAAITELVEGSDLPAVSIAMVDETGPVWVGAIGKANIEKDTDADENTLFRIGSTSKMFVALSILKLVEEGKLSLNDKLSDLAPEIAYENQWSDSDPIRIVHLLEHTTGWDDIHLPEYAHNDPTPSTLKEGLDFHPHSRISRWKPGTRMSYCNSGPPVAAYVVQKITGIDFEQYVQENFLTPLGMTSTTYRLNADVKERGATLYSNGNTPQEYWHIIVRPSGSLNSSASDMAKFAEFYINRGKVNGEQLISMASLDRMETAVSNNAYKTGQQTGYGLHNYSSSHESWVYRAHNGGVNGGITEFAYLPEAKLGHTIMINSGDGATFRRISKLIRNYETRNLTAPAINKDIEPTAKDKTIEGLYYAINPRTEMAYFLERITGLQQLSFEGNKLIKKSILGGEDSYYYLQSEGLYHSDKSAFTTLSQTSDPLAGDVVHNGTTVLKPISAFMAYFQLAIAFFWGFIIATSVVYFIIWGIRKLRGKIPSGATINIRLWPLLASLSPIAFVGLFILGGSTPFVSFGVPTVYSVGIMLATISFAVFAFMGTYTAIKERDTEMNQLNYWYCTISSFTHITVAFYLLYFGVIGMKVWG